MNNLIDILFLVAILLLIASSCDIKRISYRYWKTVPVNLYVVTAVYDIIFHTHMNTDNRYRMLMISSDMVRTEIERELGKQRPSYLFFKARTLGLQSSRRVTHDEQPNYLNRGCSSVME